MDHGSVCELTVNKNDSIGSPKEEWQTQQSLCWAYVKIIPAPVYAGYVSAAFLCAQSSMTARPGSNDVP